MRATGTSTSVGKYMKAPNSTASRLAKSVFCPASARIQSSGMIARAIPARKTPPSNRGKICLTKRHVSHSQRASSSALSLRVAT